MQKNSRDLSCDFTEECLKHLESQSNAKTIVIAYSGGLDSQVLLTLVANSALLREKYSVRAIHINHGLSPNAKLWEQHCANSCEQFAIEYSSFNLDLANEAKNNLEARARAERYKIFAENIAADEVLLTAHHEDDQAETLLLQLIRGAGVKGLAAMGEVSEFAGSVLIRPLLGFSREQLHEYAKANDLTWIDDESNFDTDFDRNFLRHEIIPLLKQRWPSVNKTLSRSARNCAKSDVLLQRQALAALNELTLEQKNILDLEKFAKFDDLQQKNILRHWIQLVNLPLCSEKKLQQIQLQMLQAADDASPCVEWQGAEIRRFKNKIYALQPQAQIPENTCIAFKLGDNLKLPYSLGKLVWRETQGSGLKINTDDQLTIRFRQGAERIQCQGKQHSQSLKKLMQEWQIPPWERDRIPLLYINDDLAAVVDFVIAQAYTVAAAEVGYELQLK